MKFKVFYEDAVHSWSRGGGDARHEEIEDIYAWMIAALTVPGDFFGIVDEEENTLQIIIEDGGTILADVPVPDRDGSLQKIMALPSSHNSISRVGASCRW